MKILIIRTHPTETNIESYNVQEIGLAKALIRAGHECDIVFFTSGESRSEKIKADASHDITIYWEKGKNILWQGIFDLSRLDELCGKYDAVQVNEYNQIASYHIVSTCKKPCVIYHGPYYNPKDWKYNLLSKLFDIFYLRKMRRIQPAVITKSVLAEQMMRGKGFINVRTAGVGLDFSRFENCEKTQTTGEKKRLLYIGEWSPRRNTLFLLEVFKKVREKCNAELVMIGRGEEDYSRQCREYIKENGLENDIIIFDRLSQEQLPQYYRSSDVFLLPTNYEIFGMVLLEAMYFGVPVISSVNGGSTTLMEDGKDGYLINEFDSALWAEKTLDLLSKEPQPEMRAKSSEKIRNSFSWDAISGTFLDEYTKQIEK